MTRYELYISVVLQRGNVLLSLSLYIKVSNQGFFIILKLEITWKIKKHKF